VQQRHSGSTTASIVFLFGLMPRILFAATTQNFDSAGTSYFIGNYQTTPIGPTSPGVTAGGPTGSFFRLTDNTINGSTGSRTAIVFPRTDSGARSKLTANFDFNLNSAVSGGGDGFSFVLLPTAIYGTNGLPTLVFSEDTRFEEPDLPGALAIAFDTFNNSGDRTLDPNGNHISLHYDGQFLQSANPGFTLLNGKWSRAAIEIDFVAGTLTLVIIEDVFGASPVIRPIFNAKKVLCLQPFESRVMFGAHTSTNGQRTDLDNINIAWTSGVAVDSTDTTQDFNGCGTDFTEDNYGGNASPGVTNFGAALNFYRLADNQIDPFGDAATNSITFDQTKVGAASKVCIDFDFNLNGSAGTGFGNGFGFALLPTSTTGTSGTPLLSGADPTRFEEPNYPNTLGIGFDTLNNNAEGAFDPNGNHVSLHWNGVFIAAATNLGFSLANGLWNHAQVQVDYASQSVSLTLIEDIYGANISHAVFTNRNIPGLASVESRAMFGARSGGARENVDLDNIAVQFDPAFRPSPLLSAMRSANKVLVSWSLFDAAFQLERKTNWNSSVWTGVTNAPSVTNNVISVTLSPTNAAGFFRLRK
jgi:hypothetical protein